MLYTHRQEIESWMEIFNSPIEVSNEFIIDHISIIQWNTFIRPLDEWMLKRLKNRIVRWNDQLYGRPLTFEFMYVNKHRFDWNLISHNPPKWFNDIHYDEFGGLMDWKVLTRLSTNMDVRILSKYADQLDWDWITENDIRGESFALRFMGLIDWDNPNIDTRNISSKFIIKTRIQLDKMTKKISLLGLV